MYKLFFQLLSQGVVWLGIVLLILTSLLPDIIFMLIGRHLFPSETQKVQVTIQEMQIRLWRTLIVEFLKRAHGFRYLQVRVFVLEI